MTLIDEWSLLNDIYHRFDGYLVYTNLCYSQFLESQNFYLNERKLKIINYYFHTRTETFSDS